MRAVFTLFAAFIASLFAGGAAAVQIAIMTGAREEFVLVFAMILFIAMMAAAAFAVAQFRSDPRTWTSGVGRWLSLLVIAIAAGLAVFSVSAAGSVEGARRDLPIIAGVVGPSLVVVLVQWLIVGWRARRAAAAQA
jgi:hypothetical protein